MRRIFWIYLVYFFLSIILSFIWFHKGFFVAFGESGILFYNPHEVINLYLQVWSPALLGYYEGTSQSLIPLYYLVSLVQHLFSSGVLTQAIFFDTFTFLSMVSGYSLFASMFDRKNRYSELAGFFGGLFYLFNFASLVMAFNRLQYPFTLFYISIPLALLLFIKGVVKRNILYALYFAIVLLPFAGAYAALPFLELLWFTLFLYCCFSIVVLWQKKKEWKFLFIFFFSSLFIWILCNLWWFLPTLQFSLFAPHAALSNPQSDIDTFIIISNWQGSLAYLFRLMSQWFFNSMIPTWGNIFFSPFFTVLSYIIPFLAFFPLLLKKKPAIVYFFLLLALVSLFFAKGSEGPFGQIFLFLFSHISVLEVFRDPFEKIGLLIPVSFTPLIGFSMWTILEWISKTRGEKTAYLYIGSIAFCMFGVLTFPFWNGWIFTYNLPPANNVKIGDYVEVPDYYTDINKYLQKDMSDTRTLVLPIGNDIGITTTWRHPYNGLEFSNILFGRPSISYSTEIPNLPNVVSQLNFAFLEKPQLLRQIMNIVVAKYLIIRSDIDYKSRSIPNPQEFISLAKSGVLQGLQFVKSFGQLQVYKMINSPSKIYAARDIYIAPQTMPLITVLSNTSFNNNDVIVNTDTTPAFLSNKNPVQVIQPSHIIDFADYPSISLESAESILPAYYKYFPDSPLYQFILLRENLLRKIAEDKIAYDLGILTRRIGELQKSILDNNIVNATILSKESINEIAFIQGQMLTSYGNQTGKSFDNLQTTTLKLEFVVNHVMSGVLNEKMHFQLQKVMSSLQTFAVNNGIQSKYDNATYTSELEKRIVYQFVMNNQGQYNLVLPVSNFSTYFQNTDTIWNIFVNNKIYQIQPTFSNGGLNFGSFNLVKGINELDIFPPTAKNLIEEDSIGEKTFMADKNDTLQTISFPIKPFDSYSPYKITVDYYLNISGGTHIQARSEFDTMQNGVIHPDWSTDLIAGGNKLQTASFIVTPYPNSTTQKIVILVEPENSCIADNPNNVFNQERCAKDRNFVAKYLHQSILTVKDIKVEKVFSTTPILIKENNFQNKENQNPEISFAKINSSKYNVFVKNATLPFLLVFGETYDAGWEAIFNDTHKKVSPTAHLLVDTFANGWYITRPGTYELAISFAPTNIFLIGEFISASIISMIICIIIYSFVLKKKRIWK